MSKSTTGPSFARQTSQSMRGRLFRRSEEGAAACKAAVKIRRWRSAYRVENLKPTRGSVRM